MKNSCTFIFLLVILAMLHACGKSGKEKEKEAGAAKTSLPNLGYPLFKFEEGLKYEQLNK